MNRRNSTIPGIDPFAHHLVGANLPVIVQAAADLAQPVWTNLATNTVTAGTSFFSDPTWTNAPRRFYRLSAQ